MKYILHTSYNALPCVDLHWDTGLPVPDGNLCIATSTDHIVELFNILSTRPYRYIVVSSNSDYSVEEQENCPVELDMQKWIRFINCRGLGYQQLNIPARCDVETCRKSDKYLVKVYSWSKASFSTVPHNVVRWFGTNLNMEHDRIVRLPFGVPQQSLDLLSVTPKSKFSVYCNMQSNTIERNTIKIMFEGRPDVISEDSVPVPVYINRLKECPFIISPPGNGGSCYRDLESLYCGAMPVLVDNYISQAYDGLPVIKINSYADILGGLRDFWDNHWQNVSFDLDGTRADLVYWENAISQEKGRLL